MARILQPSLDPGHVRLSSWGRWGSLVESCQPIFSCALPLLDGPQALERLLRPRRSYFVLAMPFRPRICPLQVPPTRGRYWENRVILPQSQRPSGFVVLGGKLGFVFSDFSSLLNSNSGAVDPDGPKGPSLGTRSRAQLTCTSGPPSSWALGLSITQRALFTKLCWPISSLRLLSRSQLPFPFPSLVLSFLSTSTSISTSTYE